MIQLNCEWHDEHHMVDSSYCHGELTVATAFVPFEGKGSESSQW